MFYLAAKGLMSYGTALVDHILPTLVGNTLGGVTMVAAINHAQVTSGK
jgi:formate/nitrite transporter FocA (FNT family)